MRPEPTMHIQTRTGENVRIGPVTVITMIIVLCMAVMGVLAISTAHATQTISDRQADATRYLYYDEKAGQEFVACIDDALANSREVHASATAGARAVEDKLDSICESARAAADGHVSCTASVDGVTVYAEFICEDTRQLNVAVTIQENGTYRIDGWKMASAQGGAQAMGNLWTGD